MKKSTKGCLIGCAIATDAAAGVVVAVVALLARALMPQSPAERAESMLQIDFPKGTCVVTNNNEMPWLPLPGGGSDGHVWMVLEVPREQVSAFTNALAVSSAWHRLPLPPALAEGQRCLQPSIMLGREETIPFATDGYYYFLDRQKAHSGYDTSKPFHERPSLNVTFGLFDETTGKVYLWDIDT